jgi:adenylate cyclase
MRETALAAWLHVGDQRFPLIGKTFSLGRAKDNNVVFSSNKVSRRHALVHTQGPCEFSLVDLGSSNGTHLNGRRVVEPILLHHGDVIQIGEESLVFEVDTQSDNSSEIYVTGNQMTVRDVNELTCWFLLLDIENFMGLTKKVQLEDLAHMVGGWLAKCRRVVEEQGGNVSKFLGDGLLVYWDTRFREPENVAAALKALCALQSQRQPSFRWALHFGTAVFGSTAVPGEVSTLGQDVNFLFRIERVAATHKFQSILSSIARAKINSLLKTRSLGSFLVKGVEGEHLFFGC